VIPEPAPVPRAPDPPPPPPRPAPSTPAPPAPTPSPAPAPSPPSAQGGNFGAIAYSPSTGANGWAYDYTSRGEAESIALTNCRKYANDCVIPVWFRNACGALATGPKGYGSGWGTDRSIAEKYALQSCGQHSSGCTVQRWVCTTR
jgi:serine/threonine-protein kinase